MLSAKTKSSQFDFLMKSLMRSNIIDMSAL